MDIQAQVQAPSAEALAESETVKKWAQIRAYGFQLGGVNYLAPVGLYCELVSEFKLAQLPNSPEHFCGLIAVRGNLVPVYQLYSVLGLSRPQHKYVFIMGSGNKAAAIMLLDKPKTININDYQLIDTPTISAPEFLQGFISGEYQHIENANDQYFALDHLKLFKALSRLHSAPSVVQ